MTFTHQIASWAALAPRRGWSELAWARGAHALEDLIASAIAGAQDASAAKLRNYAAATGDGQAVVIGSKQRHSAQVAALVNGAIAHTAEMDDNFHPGLGHACCVILPALLALGDEIDCTLADIVDAFIVGSEVMARVAKRLTRAHTDRGWHGTSAVGALASAAASARLLHLDSLGMNQAISLATSMAAGSRGQFGYEAKPLQSGLAAQAGVLAARLAGHGLTGNPAILEDRYGYAVLYGIGAETADGEAGLPRPDEPLALERWGLAFKRFPSCGSTHRALDALIALQEEHRFQPDEVAHIHTEVELGNKLNLCHPSPNTPKEAQFSMQYCVAVVLRRGRLTLADFTQDAVDDPETRQYMPLVEMTAPDMPSILDPDQRPAHHVTVRLKDGRVLKNSVRFAKGTARNPFDFADRDAKFADCCADVLDPAAARALLSLLRADLPDIRVGAVTRLLQLPAGSGKPNQQAA